MVVVKEMAVLPKEMHRNKYCETNIRFECTKLTRSQITWFHSIFFCDDVVAGNERFYYDMSMMLGYKPGRWWGICWRFITPTLIAVNCATLFLRRKEIPITVASK